MLRSHYAPLATVEVVEADELDERLSAGAQRAVGVIAPCPVQHQPSWALPADAAGFARGLYASLRAADASGVEHVLIVAPSHGDLSDAVLDRLTKAAAPRPDAKATAQPEVD